MFSFPDKYVILALSWTVGISTAVLLTVPYVLVGKYHRDLRVSCKNVTFSRFFFEFVPVKKLFVLAFVQPWIATQI